MEKILTKEAATILLEQVNRIVNDPNYNPAKYIKVDAETVNIITKQEKNNKDENGEI